MLCYRDRTLKVLSLLVPGLDPPGGIRVVRSSDTKQPHAEGRDDLFALLAAVIAKTDAGSAVHALPFCGACAGQEGGQSADTFE